MKRKAAFAASGHGARGNANRSNRHFGALFVEVRGQQKGPEIRA
jgi:hypothetical protein